MFARRISSPSPRQLTSEKSDPMAPAAPPTLDSPHFLPHFLTVTLIAQLGKAILEQQKGKGSPCPARSLGPLVLPSLPIPSLGLRRAQPHGVKTSGRSRDQSLGALGPPSPQLRATISEWSASACLTVRETEARGRSENSNFTRSPRFSRSSGPPLPPCPGPCIFSQGRGWGDVLQVYVSEIAPPGVRGALGATPQLMAVFGSLSLYALGLLLPWRWLAVAGEGPVVIMVLLLTFMPNSPRFLLSRGRDGEALQALAWLRGANADIRWEFQQIQDNVQRQSSRMSWAEARDPHIYRPIAIALLMRFLQQLTGITPILVYLQPIFNSTAVLLPPEDDAAIVGAVRLFSVLIAAVTMDLAGRKVLLFVSAAIMFAANLTLGLYVHFGPKPLTPNSTMGFEAVPLGGTEQPPATPTNYLTLVPLLATMLFIMGYAMGWGPITWLLMSEILPLRARGAASGLCVLVSWLTAFALTESFLLVVKAFGLQVLFFFFAAICLVNLVFTVCCVPETKGRSLEQIESFFRTGRGSFLH